MISLVYVLLLLEKCDWMIQITDTYSNTLETCEEKRNILQEWTFQSSNYHHWDKYSKHALRKCENSLTGFRSSADVYVFDPKSAYEYNSNKSKGFDSLYSVKRIRQGQIRVLLSGHMNYVIVLSKDFTKFIHIYDKTDDRRIRSVIKDNTTLWNISTFNSVWCMVKVQHERAIIVCICIW